MAMVQGAVYDAVNSIDGGHEPYLAGLPAASPTASMDAAVATAAYRVLDGLGMAPVPALPDDVRATLLVQYNQTLASIPDGSAKALGVDAGAAAATAMLNERAGDGRYVPFPLTPGTEPGEWRPIPPPNVIDPNSWVSEVEPFTLLSTSQFRTPGPRNLNSAAYAREYDEVKSLGSVNSTCSPEQEAIARFYNVSPLEMLNRTFRTISQTQGLSRSRTPGCSGCSTSLGPTPQSTAGTTNASTPSGGRSPRFTKVITTAIGGPWATRRGCPLSRRRRTPTTRPDTTASPDR